MTEFHFSRRQRALRAALPIAAAIAGVLFWTGRPAAAQDQASPNVIVDDSVLDGPTGGESAGEVLPAPTHQPVSRLVNSGQSAVEASTPPETTTETTYSAVPTTPIETTDLDGAEETGETAETAPAAGTSAEAEPAPEQPADAAPANAETTADDGSAQAPETAEAADSDAGDQQTAAKPPIDGMVRLTFNPDSSVLSDAAKEQLAPVVEKLSDDYMLRLQILAYAGGDDDASTHARGVSLARALAMRNYLTEQGIAIDRLDIKALGNTAQEEPADRVDLIPLAE